MEREEFGLNLTFSGVVSVSRLMHKFSKAVLSVFCAVGTCSSPDILTDDCYPARVGSLGVTEAVSPGSVLSARI